MVTIRIENTDLDFQKAHAQDIINHRYTYIRLSDDNQAFVQRFAGEILVILPNGKSRFLTASERDSIYQLAIL